MSSKLAPIAKLNAREPKMTGAGMPWCYITQNVTKEEYEREYPNDALEVGDQSSQWLDENPVRIAEYFY